MKNILIITILLLSISNVNALNFPGFNVTGHIGLNGNNILNGTVIGTNFEVCTANNASIWNGSWFNCIFTISTTYNSTYDSTTNIVNNNLENWNVTYNATYQSILDTNNISINNLQNNDTLDRSYVNNTFETLSNKSINTALGTSDNLYPSQNAVKVYSDTKQNKSGDWNINGLFYSPDGNRFTKYSNTSFESVVHQPEQPFESIYKYNGTRIRNDGNSITLNSDHPDQNITGEILYLFDVRQTRYHVSPIRKNGKIRSKLSVGILFGELSIKDNKGNILQ